MSLEGIVQAFGYPAIAVGTFLEGETILVIGGFAAHRGYLSLPWVMVCAFAGSLCSDQIMYFLGRRYGTAMLDRRPAWRGRLERVQRLLHRHQTWIILGFRFVYGLRNVTPIALGASGVSPRRFGLLNVAGAAIWAAGIGALGYFLGEFAERVIDDVKRYEGWILVGIAAAGLGLWLLHRARARRSGTRQSDQ
ncbi:MAG: DedA family protein [Planctomycetota bacterium]|nr:MAG: DedA family protein [Planctomycetota bacterium]